MSTIIKAFKGQIFESFFYPLIVIAHDESLGSFVEVSTTIVDFKNIKDECVSFNVFTVDENSDIKIGNDFYNYAVQFGLERAYFYLVEKKIFHFTLRPLEEISLTQLRILAASGLLTSTSKKTFDESRIDDLKLVLKQQKNYQGKPIINLI